ncbi:hypothetical protein ACFCZ1_33125 [Streptomyces sp. NPDC056224]|uniref:hypothetical protein n=1 Tax=Streptomyces sp. NPDC056224 TaxID=3345750 RepID=UPI0035DD8080
MASGRGEVGQQSAPDVTDLADGCGRHVGGLYDLVTATLDDFRQAGIEVAGQAPAPR